MITNLLISVIILVLFILNFEYRGKLIFLFKIIITQNMTAKINTSNNATANIHKQSK
jgi:hypothetical protein